MPRSLDHADLGLLDHPVLSLSRWRRPHLRRQPVPRSLTDPGSIGTSRGAAVAGALTDPDACTRRLSAAASQVDMTGGSSRPVPLIGTDLFEMEPHFRKRLRGAVKTPKQAASCLIAVQVYPCNARRVGRT